MKTCGTCKIEKPLTEFYFYGPKYNNRYFYQCRDCKRTREREKYRSNPKESLRIRRNYRYKISQRQYDILWVAQDGCCAICKTDEEDLTRDFAVDHNHTTGKIRGLLCLNCNTALGLLKENPELFKAAVEYLETEGV